MRHYLSKQDFPALLDVLQTVGYTCIAPPPLPHTDSAYWFDGANGASAIKPYTFAPHESLWKVMRDEAGRLHFITVLPKPQPIALLGVRACDLAALALQDQHFLHGAHPDPYYQQRREHLLLIGVNCTQAAATCFCVSTGDGPAIHSGYDLLLSELDDGFVVEAGSERGQLLAECLPLHPATNAQYAAAQQRMQAATQQQRHLPAHPPLYDLLQHPHWQNIGERCLACGQCTAVCPTCFCHREWENPDPDGIHSTHERQWDSCFNSEHSYLRGESVRDNPTEYYRQWLTHKLTGWHEQYGRSGCTGCGRCITWCPAGIDLTAEVEALT